MSIVHDFTVKIRFWPTLLTVHQYHKKLAHGDTVFLMSSATYCICPSLTVLGIMALKKSYTVDAFGFRKDVIDEGWCVAILSDFNARGIRVLSALRTATANGYLRALIKAHGLGLLTSKYGDVRCRGTGLDPDQDDSNTGKPVYEYLLATCPTADPEVRAYLERVKSIQLLHRRT